MNQQREVALQTQNITIRFGGLVACCQPIGGGRDRRGPRQRCGLDRRRADQWHGPQPAAIQPADDGQQGDGEGPRPGLGLFLRRREAARARDPAADP